MEQQSLQKKREQLAPAKAVYEQYNGMVDLIARVRYGYALTQHSNDGVVEFLTELEKKMPSDVEFTEFASDDEKCVITMRVADKETAAGIIKNFREFESLENVTVESIVEDSVDADAGGDVLENNETTVSFTLTAQYKAETLVDPATIQPAETDTEGAADAVAE